MNKLYILRHAESFGNEQRIIQGSTTDLGITSYGHKKTIEMIEEFKKPFSDCCKIISSPLKRAVETASLISEHVAIPITVDNRLVEMGSGILSGKSHQYCEENLPSEYGIWKKRGDLDGIKNAECGNYLQARALLFLFNFFGTNFNDTIIVTHCGFKRALVNTVKNLPRTSFVSPENNHVVCIQNPWADIEYKIIKSRPNKQVVSLSTYDSDYLIKRIEHKEEPLFLKYTVQKEIFKLTSSCPELYYYCTISQNGKLQTVKIEEYITGSHKTYNALCQKDLKKLIGRISNINRVLINNPLTLGLRKFKEYILDLKRRIQAEDIDERIHKYLLRSCERMVDSTEHSLILWDLHPENILFANKDKDPYFIDLEHIYLASVEYQVGSFITCFVLLNLNPQDYEAAFYEVLDLWSVSMDVDKVIEGIILRAIDGYRYFVLDVNELSKRQALIRDSYYNIFLYFYSKVVDG